MSRERLFIDSVRIRATDGGFVVVEPGTELGNGGTYVLGIAETALDEVQDIGGSACDVRGYRQDNGRVMVAVYGGGWLHESAGLAPGRSATGTRTSRWCWVTWLW